MRPFAAAAHEQGTVNVRLFEKVGGFKHWQKHQTIIVVRYVLCYFEFGIFQIAPEDCANIQTHTNSLTLLVCKMVFLLAK